MDRKKRDTGNEREGAVGCGVVQVSASELRNAWHEWLQRVAEEGQTLVVTRYGRPIAKVSPAGVEAASPQVFGALAGSVKWAEDIISPAPESWDAGS